MDSFKRLLEKEQLYIVGVSGGCDSMALLDMLFKSQYQIFSRKKTSKNGQIVLKKKKSPVILAGDFLWILYTKGRKFLDTARIYTFSDFLDIIEVS